MTSYQCFTQKPRHIHLAYLAPAPIPSRSANSVHVMKMCEALAKHGCELTLFVPKLPAELKVDDVYDFYDVQRCFEIVWVDSTPRKGQKLRYAYRLLRQLRGLQPSVVFSRDLYSSTLLTLAGIKVLHEFHYWKNQWPFPLSGLLKRFKRSRHLLGLISITDVLAEQLTAAGFAKEKIRVVPDAAAQPTTETVRPFASDRFRVGYLGHLYPGKGMEVIAQLVPLLPEVDFHIVGGRPDDVAEWQTSLAPHANIMFHGHVAQGEISAFLNGFDCCLLPNQRRVYTSGGNAMDIGAVTSPLKMFDYLAHGKAIVSSDLPVLREVLDESVAIFAEPDDPESWRQAILSLKNNTEQRQQLARQGKALFDKKYSWNQRAQHVLAFIKSSS